MPKRILQDIVLPPKGRAHSATVLPRRAPRAEGASDIRYPSGRKPWQPAFGTGKNSKFIIWGIAAAAILFVLVSIFSLFEKATIKIVPKQRTATINTEISAHRGTAASGGLVFEIMTLTGEEQKTFPATQVERVDRQASGKIIIYNNFDTQNQRLIKQTRFETPDGLIYRIKDSVVVPGQKTVGGEKIPGSVEVTVYADEPGEKYNIGLSDFTIPGFKGSPRFNKFYARSKTPISDGFSGIVKTISPRQLAQAEQDLSAALRAQLLEKASSQKPDNFVLYDDAVFFSLEGGGVRAIQTNVNKDEVDVIVSGTLYSLIFNRNTLSQFLANLLVSNIQPDDRVIISNLDSLEFAVSNKDLFSPALNTTLSFVLQGSPHIVWLFDEAKLKEETLGVSKKDFKEVLANYPNIERAEVALRPFWKRSFPPDPDKIKIEVIVEEQ